MNAIQHISPQGWPVVELGEIANIFGGKPAPQDPKAFNKAGIPFVRMKDLGRYHLTPNLQKVDGFIDQEYALINKMEPIKAGAILMPRSGSVALNHRAILGRDAIIVSHICAIQVNDSKNVSNHYLYRFLCTQRFENITKKTTGLDAINFSDLRKLKVPLPPIDMQRRIAVILDKADLIHGKRERALSLADDFIKSVFLEMFGDPMMNAKGLRKEPLGKFGRIVTGNTPSRSDPENFGTAIEWIKSDNVNTEGHYLTRAAEGLSLKGKELGRTVPCGSILVTCIAGSPASIGKAAIADRAVAFNQQINAIIPSDGVNLYFLYVQFLIAKSLVLKSSTNSMKGMISKGEFQKIDFIFPNLDQQNQFGKIFEKHVANLRRLENASDCSEELFSTLSQCAFRGEL